MKKILTLALIMVTSVAMIQCGKPLDITEANLNSIEAIAAKNTQFIADMTGNTVAEGDYELDGSGATLAIYKLKAGSGVGSFVKDEDSKILLTSSEMLQAEKIFTVGEAKLPKAVTLFSVSKDDKVVLTFGFDNLTTPTKLYVFVGKKLEEVEPTTEAKVFVKKN